jgi:hypothetical protein
LFILRFSTRKWWQSNARASGNGGSVLGGGLDAKHGAWRFEDGESDFLVCFKAMSDSFDLFLDKVGVDDKF